MNFIKSLLISVSIISFFAFLFLIPATIIHENIHKSDFKDIEIGSGNICLFNCGKENLGYYLLSYNNTLYSAKYIHQRELKSEIRAYSASIFTIILGGAIGLFVSWKCLNHLEK